MRVRSSVSVLLMLNGVLSFMPPPVANRGVPRYPSSPAVSKNCQTQIGNPTALFGNKEVDGTGRGSIILGVVFLINVWVFSIPPEFRRAYLCPSEPCIENRAMCNDCITFDEWKSGIEDYYKNGGGIKFDFSIDPKSKAQFSEATGLNL